MVSPLVAWIWIGGTIIVAGAMVAVWPPPSARRQRARVAAAAPRGAAS
jgi:cytochrome c-type biogenesis protein CcmF